MISEIKEATSHLELQRLLDLTGRIGNDPLLTQASTGNSSVKLEGVLWIKASGRWMADAGCDDILVALNLKELVEECLHQQVDPSHRFPGASVETSLHAALPHRIVLHVHCVNTVSWAIRRDGAVQLHHLLDGLPWQWIPYVASGLPLARAAERALGADPGTKIFVLGNHGLVVCGSSTDEVEELLGEVRERVETKPRPARRADYEVLASLARDGYWEVPADERIHSLGTDPVSRLVVGRGYLYPCQVIFAAGPGANPFEAVPEKDLKSSRREMYSSRPFLIVEGRGVLIRRSISPAELAMLSGLAEVVQRLSPTASLRYLTETEVAAIPGHTTDHYRQVAGARRAAGSQGG